jgi:hypothetical protein
MIERIYFYTIIFSQKDMGSEKHTADVVVHDMIEQIYFYSMIFSQKEIGSKKHMADVVVPGSAGFQHPDLEGKKFYETDVLRVAYPPN